MVANRAWVALVMRSKTIHFLSKILSYFVLASVIFSYILYNHLSLLSSSILYPLCHFYPISSVTTRLQRQLLMRKGELDQTRGKLASVTHDNQDLASQQRRRRYFLSLSFRFVFVTELGGKMKHIYSSCDTCQRILYAKH